jgi:phenylglyoxylate dehydrogenase epsilon subunit
MPHSKYLILGSSHAALEAAAAIRMHRTDCTLTLLTRDARLPYSPTVLPYIVSGRSQPDKVVLRHESYFRDNDVALVRGATVVAVEPDESRVRLQSGEIWQYDRLLIATGASPALPEIPGLNDVRYHVLRSMDDAVGLQHAIGKAKSAIVLGAGLIGMHAAENMAKAGLAVTVVELQSHVLPGYFSERASALIAKVFAGHGVRVLTGHSATKVEKRGDGCIVTIDDAEQIAADLLLICTGVKPNISFLDGSGVETDFGILVDDRMRTSAPNVWAAGDVAQARGFWGGKVVNGILPSAVEQGRIAGFDMADDQGAAPYHGAVPHNTYSFFGQHAISVGLGVQPQKGDGIEIEETIDDQEGVYRRIAFKDGQLFGISTINDFVDAGIMCELIRRRVDLSPMKSAFIANPRDTGRQLMSRTWR